MKNKLLKSSFLVIPATLLVCFCWINHPSELQSVTKEDAKILRKNAVKEPLSNLPSFDRFKNNINPLKKSRSVAINNKWHFSGNNNSIDSDIDFDSIEKVRAKYHELVNNSIFRKRMRLSKSDRKQIGIPPNAFNEQEFIYTADPNLGRPTHEVLLDLQKTLDRQLEEGRVPGDGLDNQWVERGSNNVGGRTRVVMFAPGSTTKVFAGAVNGGLWVNNDITLSTGTWTQVSGVPSNMAVTCMTVDPLNSNVMYIGTGEVYTSGAVNGNGVYKSIDGGNNWRLVFGTPIGSPIADQLNYIQDIIAWVNPATNRTEIFFGADAAAYGEEVTAGSGGTAGFTFGGVNTIGLYRSIDGSSFARLTNLSLETSTGRYVAPESFAITTNGDLFMGTKRSAFGAGGGRVYRCTNGTNWTLVRTFTDVNARVRLVASKQTNGRMFALCENRPTTGGTFPVIKRTTDNFATTDVTVSLPVSVGNQPPAANDFCRGQAFYDLLIGMNPTNDNEVYVGGIEIFKTTTAFSGTASSMWTQLTDWTVNAVETGTTPTLDGVHSDHHAIAFAPGLNSRVVFGGDGGVYYTNNSGTNIYKRNRNYNVTQSYKADINSTTLANDRLISGLQDNGSQYIASAQPGNNPSAEIAGGDGAWEFIEDTDAFLISSYVYNVYYRHAITGTRTYTITNNQNDGDFINQCGLDSANDRLYANGTTPANVYQIYKYDLGATSATRRILTNALLNDIPTFFKPMPVTTTSVLVGLANGRLLRINNAANAIDNTGTTWSSIGNATWNGAVSDIRFGLTENDIFVTFHNYGVVSVWYTNDGGTTWQNKEGDLPNIPVKCILQNPNATNEVIIGTELGVWYTVNFNSTTPNWRRANNGMKDVKVMNFEYRPSDRTIVASTHGRGIWTGKFFQCGDLSTSWNGSAWSNGVPTSKTAVTFNGNFNSTSSIDACSVVVNSGFNVVFNSGHTLRVGENITVSGTGNLTFENNSALVQYTKHAVNTGNITVKRNSANMIRQDYTAWGSPVINQNLLTFSPNTLTNRFYEYLFTGTTTPTAYQSVNPSTNSFQTAKGYMIRVANNWTSTSPGLPFLGQFRGVPNNGTIKINVGQGYNLLSNPYASPINAKTFLINNPKVDALYYWTHTVPAVGSTYPSNNYASYTMLGGTASANGSEIPNDFIQVGQGFFVLANSAFEVNFENEFRVDAALSTQFFRTDITNNLDNEETKHRIWLNLNSSTNAHNQILVGYMNGATENVDKKIDAIVLDNTKSMIYSLINDKEYVIQGRGLPFDENDTIAIGFKATENSSYEIEIDNFDGLFENQNIYLKDNFVGAVHNLKEGKYFFLSQEGDFKNRFELVFKKPIVSQEIVDVNQVFVFVNDGKIILKASEKNIQSFEIYDVLGKQVLSKSNINSKEYVVLDLVSNNQSFIIKLFLEDGRQIIKKVIF